MGLEGVLSKDQVKRQLAETDLDVRKGVLWGFNVVLHDGDREIKVGFTDLYTFLEEQSKNPACKDQTFSMYQRVCVADITHTKRPISNITEDDAICRMFKNLQFPFGPKIDRFVREHPSYIKRAFDLERFLWGQAKFATPKIDVIQSISIHQHAWKTLCDELSKDATNIQKDVIRKYKDSSVVLVEKGRNHSIYIVT